jgi:hypothetical protein
MKTQLPGFKSDTLVILMLTLLFNTTSAVFRIFLAIALIFWPWMSTTTTSTDVFAGWRFVVYSPFLVALVPSAMVFGRMASLPWQLSIILILLCQCNLQAICLIPPIQNAQEFVE